MEGELNSMIEQMNEHDKKQDSSFEDDLDIDNFDRKIKDMRDQSPENDMNSSNSSSHIQISSEKKKLNNEDSLERKKLNEITSQLVFKNDPKSKVLETITENPRTENMKDRRIRELVLKNKSLYVNLEKEKSMRVKLEKEMQNILKETETNIDIKRKKLPESEKKDESKEDYKAKYIQADKKIQELRFEKQTLKNELNKASRLISREIGENINIDEILLNENSWKGRSQQIQILQNKVKDLQGKLSNNTIYSEQKSELGGTVCSNLSVNGKIAEERRKELENLKQQVNSMKSENELLQGKIKALNSRKSILEGELKEMRQNYEENKTILLEKSQNDDKYIIALKAEIEKLKTQIRSVPLKSQPLPISQKSSVQKSNSLPNEEIELLKTQLQQKEKIIKELLLEKNNKTQLDPSIEFLKQENATLNALLSRNADKDVEFTMQTLCQQNANLRKKVYDLESKLHKKELN